jgi:hypothetical protein
VLYSRKMLGVAHRVKLSQDGEGSSFDATMSVDKLPEIFGDENE